MTYAISSVLRQLLHFDIDDSYTPLSNHPSSGQDVHIVLKGMFFLLQM